MITVTQHVKNEWSRMATAAYAVNQNLAGTRYSVAASIPADTMLTCERFDFLQSGYRAWLVFNEYPQA